MKLHKYLNEIKRKMFNKRLTVIFSMLCKYVPEFKHLQFYFTAESI